jgi:hypothetical protein
MNARILILIVLMLGAAAFIGYRVMNTPRQAPVDDGLIQNQDQQAYTIPDGVPPEGDPEFECSIEITREGNQNIMYMSVREIHGWWAENLYVNFWHRSQDPDTGEWERDTRVISHLLRQPVPFNDTYTDRVVIVDTDHEGVEVGTSENWECEVERWDRALAPRE